MNNSPRMVVSSWLSLCLLLISGCDYWVSDATRLERAAQAKAGGDFGLAAVELRNVLQDQPNHRAARVELVDVLLLNGEAPAARYAGEALWGEQGTDARVAELRVRVELANGNARQLLEELDKASLALPPPRASVNS